MSTNTGKFELTRKRVAALAVGALALVGAAVGATVLVEHRLHGHGAGAAHGAGEAHDHAHGEEEHDHGEHQGHDNGDTADRPHGAHDDNAHGGEDEHAGGKLRLSPAMIENAGIELLTAGPGKVAVTLRLPGEIALNAEGVAHVTPRVPGAAREVKKQLGDAVKKGDLLAVLDSRELAELQRELLAAKERLTLAEASYARQEALWKEQISAEKEYLAAKQAVAEARIEHRSAVQKLGAAAGAGGGKAGGYALIAPIDGTIIEKHIAVGEVLKEDTQVFVIADLSTVWVNVTVYAKDLHRVRVGQAAWVTAEGTRAAARGTVTYLGHVLDEGNRSASARVELREPDKGFRPGLFATVDVSVEEVDAPVVVADEAIQRVDGKEVVFVQEGDAFEARPVKLGRRGAADPAGQGAPVVEIAAGMSAGDRYVGKNSFVLKAELGKPEGGHAH
ncbi:efflux RND transporter periplasmic adaptor subunit [Sorangium cellulosum]|uniref:Heavy metal resistance protein CzcB n=1 Tax=Sorangium cellulosum TaxID=56 RepID=A0A150QT00_SORCE|nr:efflux RND transporter periplasmic adaptor subunit [Sorangium cellulosum]KYF70786.1 heavy metal resistance protein CzcB [Sorangium cellulosum]